MKHKTDELIDSTCVKIRSDEIIDSTYVKTYSRTKNTEGSNGMVKLTSCQRQLYSLIKKHGIIDITELSRLSVRSLSEVREACDEMESKGVIFSGYKGT